MNKKTLSSSIPGVVLGMFLASSVVAQSTWTGAINNDYNTAGNWSPSGVPGFGSAVVIDSGTPTFTGTDNFFERGAATTLDGGDLLITNARFLNGRGGPAVFNMESGSLTQTNSTYFIVSQNNTGTFNQSGGVVDITIGRGFFLTDGGGLGGTYNLTNGTLDVKMNRYGSDSLTNGLFNAWVGRGASSSGDLMYVDGGTFNLSVTGPAGADRNFLIASDGTFRVDSGNVDMDGLLSFTVGQARVSNTTSNFEVNGGNVSLEVEEGLIIGAGVSGSLDVTDGVLDIIGSGADLILGDVSISDTIQTGGKSALTTSVVSQSGGDVSLLGDVILSLDSNNTGTYTLTGGTLTANDILVGSGTGLFEFLGGTITLTGDRTSLLSEVWFDAAPGAFANFDGVNTVFAIPEPGTVALVASALALGVAVIRRRRQN